MTIVLKPAQERLIHEAIRAGLIGSVEEFIDAAIDALPHNGSEPSSRQAAVARMLEFGDKYRLTLGEPVSRQLLQEGHRR